MTEPQDNVAATHPERTPLVTRGRTPSDGREGEMRIAAAETPPVKTAA